LRASLKEMTKERDHLALNCEKYREDLGHEAAFRSDNCSCASPLLCWAELVHCTVKE
jgi:hypothetical protein